jgi:hypothetical protein
VCRRCHHGSRLPGGEGHTDGHAGALTLGKKVATASEGAPTVDSAAAPHELCGKEAVAVKRSRHAGWPSQVAEEAQSVVG